MAEPGSSPPFIIPIFIAHQGCPHRCLFCNQHGISGGGQGGPDPDQVAEIIRSQLAWPRRRLDAPIQVAFYGGSFTGLPIDRQRALLAAVQPFLERGTVGSIRISTRPDAITPDIADFLWDWGVRIVELGAQSFSDAVLAASLRGHDVIQIGAALACLRAKGMKVGLQLMLGLPGETTASCLAGARQAVALMPDLVRIYPCLVVAGSPLAELYRQGGYRPLSLAAAVVLSGKLLQVFEDQGIVVVRMGLQPSPSLAESLVVGPYHPAFGELVRSRLLFRRIRALLAQRPAGIAWDLILALRDQSLVLGRKNACLDRLRMLGLLDRVSLSFRADQARGQALLLPSLTLLV